MLNQNIISNKFDLNWSTTFSYKVSNGLAYSVKARIALQPWHLIRGRHGTKLILEYMVN
jgi:hypothetical protein